MSDSKRTSLQWAELITTIAVLLSLIFVGWEIRQNTSIARSQARNDLATLNQDWLMGLAADSTLQDAFSVRYMGGRELTPLESQRALNVMIALVRRLEAAYLFYDEGLIPEDALRSYGMLGPWFLEPTFREEFWPGMQDSFNADFVEYANRIWGF